jgi:SsrA-binding protein
MILAENKKARFEYEWMETFQAGMALSSALVKQIRTRKVPLVSSFVVYQNSQLQIINLGNNEIRENVPLLLGAREKKQIMGAIKEKGVTCVVIDLHTHKRWLKARIAIARGKTEHDKRVTLKARDLDREERKGML